MSRTFEIRDLANIPQYREDDGEDQYGNSREIVVGYDSVGNLIELTLIYDDTIWDFIVIHANKAQEPYKGRFLKGK